MSTHIDVVTWNIHGGLDEQFASFNFGRMVAEQHADIIALQEVDTSHMPFLRASPELSNAGLIHGSVRSFSPSPFSDGSLAVAVGSKCSVIESWVHSLSNPAKLLGLDDSYHDKGVLGCRFEWRPGIAVDVLAVHFFPLYRIGLDEKDPALRSIWVELSDALAPRDGVPRIVLGDFNAEHRSELLDVLRHGLLSSLFTNCSTRSSGECHDDILVGSEFRVLQRAIFPTLSDHHLLRASLLLQ